MNSIDRWKIADRMQKRSGVWYMEATMKVEDAVDECVKIIDELVRKAEFQTMMDGLDDVEKHLKDRPLKSWERDTHKLWSEDGK